MKRFWAWGIAVVAATTAYGQTAPTDARQDAIWREVDQTLAERIDTLFHEGDLPLCIDLLYVRYVLNPGDYESMSNLGWLLESTDRADEALSLYVSYRLSYPDRGDAAYAEAEFYFKRKAWARVIPLIEPELKKAPDPNMFRMLAHSYERVNRLKDSLRVWDAYLKYRPEDQAAKNNRQRVAQKMATTS